ncbi:MAG: hypothetical protein R3A44_36750 [Caldilineaceae bacterium]
MQFWDGVPFAGREKEIKDRLFAAETSTDVKYALIVLRDGKEVTLSFDLDLTDYAPTPGPTPTPIPVDGSLLFF